MSFAAHDSARRSRIACALLCALLLAIVTACGDAAPEKESAGAMAQTLDAKALLALGTVENADWTGRPDRSRVELSTQAGGGLVMYPRGPNSKTRTTLRIPLAAGEHRLAGEVVLSERCEFDALLEVTISGPSTGPRSLGSLVLAPGKPAVLSLATGAVREGSELTVTVEMAPHAENAAFSQIRLTKLQLTSS